jgi:2-oxoglutarate dehydrogenase E2 component (dihydrolipoamide succinyltransferase)
LKRIKFVWPESISSCKSQLTAFQIDVAVNAPEAGTIKELLANEEDTVTVGQDLVKLEPGGSPGGAEKESASSEPKEPASSDQSTSSEPKPSKKDSSTPAPPAEEKKQEPSAQEQPKKESPSPKQTESKPEPKKTEPKPSSSAPTLGNREERRVGVISVVSGGTTADRISGQNESDASTNC